MITRTILTAMGTLLGGVVGWTPDQVPPADPAAVRRLLADLGVTVGRDAGELDGAVRRFQRTVGLTADGVAGPRTVHQLARYAREARDLCSVRSLAAA